MLPGSESNNRTFLVDFFWLYNMGLVENFKRFVHSITTENHYASYGSPYKNSSINNIGNVDESNGTSRSDEFNRLNTLNSSSNSIAESGGGNGAGVSQSRNDSPAKFGYRPGLRTAHANSSDFQLQNLGQQPFPSIDSLWDRIEAWLEEEYPELGDSLNNGATTADLNEFENDRGVGSLPIEVRQFIKRHDGQMNEGKPAGLLMGLTLLDLESIAEEHNIWGRVAERIEKQKYILQHRQKQDQMREGKVSQQGNSYNSAENSFIANQKSIPPNAIQPVYAHKGWIPFTKDYYGNQIAIDLVPGPKGSWGQIILFGRDFDTKLVIASNLQEFLYVFLSDLEGGRYAVDQGKQNERYGYLESTRDDDYIIGDDEEDQGDLCFFDKDNEFGNDFKGKGKVSYIDIMKCRALKKYGITDVENYSTTYTMKRNQVYSSMPSSAATQNSAGIDAQKSSTTLLNMDNSKVSLPKETIIDDYKSPDSKTESTANEGVTSASNVASDYQALQSEDAKVAGAQSDVASAEKDSNKVQESSQVDLGDKSNANDADQNKTNSGEAIHNIDAVSESNGKEYAKEGEPTSADLKEVPL